MYTKEHVGLMASFSLMSCFIWERLSFVLFQMMADLMFRKNEYDSATFHFQQLLERKPG